MIGQDGERGFFGPVPHGRLSTQDGKVDRLWVFPLAITFVSVLASSAACSPTSCRGAGAPRKPIGDGFALELRRREVAGIGPNA
jgi:hypothetical protein